MMQQLRVALPMSKDEARALLANAIDARVSLEASGGSRSRYLGGEVTGDSVTLRVDNARVPRKSWNVGFRGELRAVESGSELVGATTIADERDLRRILWLFRLAALAPLLVVFANVPNEDTSGQSIGGIVFALVVLVATWVGTTRLERFGLRAAAEDAQLLAAWLRSGFSTGLGRVPSLTADMVRETLDEIRIERESRWV